ncbi:MAG TPA: GlxA family transcriptional regulator [Steroidobacteraceae bacterium]|nr:GlxA family transcriptional regulator [Steroidobacteraceae bacterium]
MGLESRRAGSSRRKLAFLLLPEFSYLGLAAATEPLFIANWLAQEPLFEWKILSADGKPVRASNGMVVPVDGDLTAGAAAKTVFVLASFEPDRAVRERSVVRWLKRLARFGAELGGIENGSLVLAEAGLLNGHKVAVHWDNLMGFREHYPATRAVAQLYAQSGDRITCAGASAILDMMVAWIGSREDADLAAEVAEHLLLTGVRAPESEQRAPQAAAPSGLDALVARAQAIMRAHVDEPLTCREIARRVGISLRQLERRFKEHAGGSVLKKYRVIRIAKAHQLLQQTELSVTEVALSCGFSSPEYFCRLYRGMFDCSPSEDRRQSTTAPVLRQRLADGRLQPRAPDSHGRGDAKSS